MSQEPSPSSLSIVDEFLTVGLLGELGKEENRYEYLEKTVETLKADLTKKPSQLVRFSLTAFEPKPNSDDAHLESTYQTLKRFWKTIDTAVF